MPAETMDGGHEAAPQKSRTASKSPNSINEDGLSECFRVVRTNMYVSLAPCHITNPINGIKSQHLDPMIMKYYNKARGVVLSYSNLSIQDQSSKDADGNIVAKVTDASPFSFMWITVDLLLWYPQLGDILEGTVYMQTASHIGLLLHDTFNASIKYKNIPQDWQFIPSQADEFADNDGADSNSGKFKSFGWWFDGNNNKIEGKLRFTVRALYTSGRMLSMDGSLVSPESEIDAQPVSNDSSAGGETAPVSKHITFDDEPTPESAPQSDIQGLPRYGNSENANSSSSEEDSDSD